MRDNVIFCRIPELENHIPADVRVFAVVDSNVGKILSQKGFFLSADKMFILEASEADKTLQTVENIAKWLLENEAGRDAWLLGIGGGIVTDITGMLASIYKRGIRFSLVPTTLLAQVDAAIGGKTGVNLGGVKNVLGTFAKAESIVVDTDMLRTLPQREIVSGLAEALKTFIIGDAQMFERAGADLSEEMIRRCIEIKSDIVEQDRHESGLRQMLNLGHTVGHAVETLSRGKVSHGEAVAAGIMAAAQIGKRLGACSESVAQRIEEKFLHLGYKSVPELLEAYTDIPREDCAEKLMHFIRNDKKRKEDFVNFVLIRDIGSVKVEAIRVAELEKLIHDLCYHR